MSFEPGLEQGPDRHPGAPTLFFSRGNGYTLELGPAQAYLELDALSSKPTASENAAATHPDARSGAITLKYLGADAAVAVSGQKMLPGKHNYIPTGDPATWHTNVPTYAAVEYKHLYPGVDLSFYGNSDRLEYDFTVAPASDPGRIKLSIAGAQSVSTDPAGDLVLVSEGRTVRFLKPVAYQTLPGGERRTVDAAYRLSRHGRHAQPEIAFALGDYDHSQPLIIDPVVDYAFYLPQPSETGYAGAGYLYVGASTTDAEGNTYIAGTFPYITHERQNNGFFIAKFNAAGTQIYDTTFGAVQSPYFSGFVNGIAVDNSGNVYITGLANSLPIVNGYQTSGGGGFIAVISSSGLLTYSSYFGSNGVGDGISIASNAIAVDSSGNAYIVGAAVVPTTTGAAVPTRPSNGPGYVAKFNPNLVGTASLIYSTYLGGTQGGAYIANGVAVDSAGNAYVTGSTAADYPTTPGAYAYNGRYSYSPVTSHSRVFVTKVSSAGTEFSYSAILGPGLGQAIAVDSSGDAYVTGTVYEDDYPTTSGAYQTTYPSGFVTELNPSGSALVYSTFLGGPSDHLATGSSYIYPTHLALPPGCSSACTAYVAGVTNGSDLPLVDPVQSYVPGSTWSGFYMELAGNGGSLLQSSYFASGSGFDSYQNVPGIGVDSSANIYLTGDVLPLDFPVTQATSGPTGEGFLAKIGPSSGAKLAISPSSIAFPTQIVGVSTAQEGIALPTVYLENLGDQAVTLSAIKSSNSAFSQTNNCNGTVAAGGSCILTLSYTPSGAAAQTGTIAFTSSATVNPTLQVSGTGTSDRYLVASCGGVSPCPGLTFPDAVLPGGAPAQVVTVTNYGNNAVAIGSISGNLPDFGYLSNCPQTGTGLHQGQSCQISISFAPRQVGLRSGTFTITSPGTAANTIVLPVAGTGTLNLSPNPSSLVLLGSTLNFGTVTLGASSATQTVTVFNNGTAPATVFAPVASTSGDAAGTSDYAVTANTCGQVLPEASCAITLAFAPTATGTRTGTLTIPTSASSTALSSSLTGIGVATKQTLEFSPDAITFPDQVIDSSSAAVSASVYNTGPAPVYIDRVVITGSYLLTYDSCSQTTLAIPTPAGSDTGCSIQVEFSPTSTGVKTGTVTVIDSEGNQTPLSLAGTGIAQTGMLYFSQGNFNFGTEPVGTPSTSSELVTNIGNSSVTLNAVTATGDYSYSFNPSITLPYVLASNTSAGLYIHFNPSKVANPDNGTVTLTTSAGNYTVNLTGVGVAATKSILLSPPTSGSFNFGSVEVGKMTDKGDIYAHYVTVYNAGTDPVTFTAAPAISGTDASDFGLALDSCNNSNVLSAGGTCSINVYFSPSAAGTRTATLTITDNATTGNGTQTLTLTGTGTSTQPAYTLDPNTVAFYPQSVNTVSVSYGDGDAVTFYNNSAAPITISTVTLSPSGIFTQSGTCSSGKTVAANGGSCGFTITFAPTAAGQINGTATLTDSTGKTYVAQLYAYATPVVDSVYVNPLGLNFAPQPQLVPASALQSLPFTMLNSSTLAVAIGQATVTNPAFKILSDSCSNKSQHANSQCSISIALSPTASTAVGNQSGIVTIPVTYADNTTSSATVTLSGTVLAPYNSAELSPSVLTFLDRPVNTTSSYQTVTLYNRSNESFTVGTLTSTNTSSNGPFKIGGANCGSSLAVGASCVEPIQFAPTTAATGVKGTLTFPITFLNGKTTSLTATYSGNALAATNSLIITPDFANFGPEVVGQAYGGILFNVTNTGNQPVPISAITLSSTQSGTNFTRNGYNYGQCGTGNLAAGASCAVFVEFAPQTVPNTNNGTINGTLTIADGSASGGPHTIPLVGVGVAANQTIALSQSTVSFGNVTVGTTSAQQAVYVTNQSASLVSGFTYTLGGTNASDFTLQANTCPTTIYAKQTCSLLVSFNPATASLVPRTATVTVAFGGSTGSSIGSPITLNLQGTGVPPAPNVALFPASIAFPTQAIGSKSAGQYFRLYNTGSASLSVTAFSSTNAAEFSLVSNTCSGTAFTVASGGSCLVGVAFSPSATGARSGTVKFTDNSNNVAGSTQSVALTGTGVAVPLVTLAPASLAFGNQNVGSVSTAQTITLSNPGAAALAISSIALGGTNPGDFTIASNLCGSTLASNASCSLTVRFAPTVAGSRSASVVFSDNADDTSGVAQPTQTVILGGTGVGIPSAQVTPSSLGFGSLAVGTPSAAMMVTLHNTGTGALTSSIALSGTDPGDYSISANGCGTSLAVGAQCAVSVTFKAKAAGARTANLVFTDNSGLVSGTTQTVSLSGTGI